jgi:hypothetical protein
MEGSAFKPGAVCAPMHPMKWKNDQQNNAIRDANGSAKPS